MTESVYVHIDTTSNVALTKGLIATDFANSTVHLPQSLLLLDPSALAGEHESHTGLKIIRDIENIQRFPSSSRNRRGFDELKWINFTDLTMLKELTPLEISESSYFGHMKTHLHSPFSYKLQNNFVHFDLDDQLNQIHYRYLDKFYKTLASKLSPTLSGKINVKKSFFKKETPVGKISMGLLREMRSLMQEGIIFSFDQAGLIDGEYRIPIYVTEDYTWKLKGTRYREEETIAILIYSVTDRHW